VELIENKGNVQQAATIYYYEKGSFMSMKGEKFLDY
jgi:hypothetical protein